MADYLIKGETLSGIANAIRSKTGETESIIVENMSGKIEGIKAGGTTRPDLNNPAGAKDILRANKRADKDLGVDDIYYYIEKEYSYKVVGQKAGILESERVY